MNRTVKYLILSASVAALCLAASCSDDTDLIQSQRNNIYNYINRTTAFQPLEDHNYAEIGGAYRLVADNKLEEWERTAVAKGDDLTINFIAYIFTTAPASYPYFSNNPDSGMEGWPTEPLKIKLGDGEILKSIENTLPGCVKGDSVLVFLPSNVAYGANALGVVPANSALQFNILITDVAKN